MRGHVFRLNPGEVTAALTFSEAHLGMRRERMIAPCWKSWND